MFTSIFFKIQKSKPQILNKPKKKTQIQIGSYDVLMHLNEAIVEPNKGKLNLSYF
jgi:hypothetical protein